MVKWWEAVWRYQVHVLGVKELQFFRCQESQSDLPWIQRWIRIHFQSELRVCPLAESSTCTKPLSFHFLSSWSLFTFDSCTSKTPEERIHVQYAEATFTTCFLKCCVLLRHLVLTSNAILDICSSKQSVCTDSTRNSLLPHTMSYFIQCTGESSVNMNMHMQRFVQLHTSL